MLTIALVNNMAPAAIQSTERQFRDILTTAAQNEIAFQMRYFRLAGARPSHYEPMDHLWDSSFDGVIVTGAEPKMESLTDEVFWPSLTRTIDWAMDHTSSAVWSCLAAHATVLHLDGVQRHTNAEKIFGVFSTQKTDQHDILRNVEQWSVPHSRWNGLEQADLVAHGYKILAMSQDAGVDTFIKLVGGSLFVFFQSHPEYDPHILMREYRRDVARFLGGQHAVYPNVPRNYFPHDVVALLESHRHQALNGTPSGGLDVLERTDLPEHNWTATAIQVYRNWLGHLTAMRKTP